ncbi:MAG: DNA-processing protein DprA [Bacillota bacterium]
MIELYTYSQLLKSHPIYNLHRDEIHNIYRSLGFEGNLNIESLASVFLGAFPELESILHKNLNLYKDKFELNSRQAMKGVKFVCYGEKDYPSQCYLMADSPLCLSYVGTPCWQAGGSMSIVGSREPSSESLLWMEQELSSFLTKAKPLVVSGGARGVDQKAHALALRKLCTTAVILPSGLGEIYPESLKDWVRPIIDQGGCLISEYDYQQKMHKHLFHHRNRLIAALGTVTLLVEARRRSGTLITAHQAAQLGRPVLVVPGHPQDPHFQGSLDLLFEGAQMARDAEDLLMLFHSELINEKMDSVGVVGFSRENH